MAKSLELWDIWTYSKTFIEDYLHRGFFVAIMKPHSSTMLCPSVVPLLRRRTKDRKSMRLLPFYSNRYQRGEGAKEDDSLS